MTVFAEIKQVQHIKMLKTQIKDAENVDIVFRQQFLAFEEIPIFHALSLSVFNGFYIL